MYQIYIADLGKATKNEEIGSRPVVVISKNKYNAKLLKITSRMRPDNNHIRMNNYIIHGFCDVHNIYNIDTKYLKNYIRDCTVSEQNSIYSKIKK